MKKVNRAMAWVLALALTLGMIPAVSPLASARNVVIASDDLSAAYRESRAGDVIQVNGNMVLDKPLFIDKDITITGTGTIKPGNGFVPGATDSTSYNSMIVVTNGTLTIESGVTFNMGRQCRAIEATGSTVEIVLNGCTFRNGHLENSLQGGAVYLNKGAALTAKGGAEFSYNRSDDNSATGGGALYVGNGCTATLEDVTFSGNRANSGGAIYTYKGTVTTTAATTFTGNSASQRGGTIHDHGTVVLNKTTITGSRSDQYGGAVYVSASGTDIGRLVLQDAQITGNDAGNSGAGVFIADTAEVYINGSTKVTGNTVTDGSALGSNLFASTSTSKVIAYGKLTSSKGELGVSTANPYKSKMLVYSLVGGTHGLAGKTVGGISIPSSYTMTATTGGDMEKFVYDSEVYLLKQSGKTGNMWLTYNPDVGGGGGGPQVIFDYNLPGAAATVYPSSSTIASISKGDKIPLPVLGDSSVGNVDFKFLGWYTDATGGTKITGDVTADEGTRIYYAQWDVDSAGGGGGTPVPGDLFSVFWDYNYANGGGGVTSSLVGTFKLSTTVTVTASTPDGSATSTETQTKDVTVAFSVPRPPVRYGYTFKGWGTSPTAATGTNTPATPTKSTTYYAVWAANDCTVTWDANGGNGGTTTTQKYDTTAAPPAANPTRTGYTFTGWYIDAATAVPLTSGTIIRGAVTFYAGWDAIEYTITWDVNYTGGSVTNVQQRYDADLLIMPAPVRTGYAFGGWYTGPNGTGTRADAYGTITGNETFYANWVQGAIDYTVTVDWADQSDNDAVRPDSITVELTRNDLPTGQTYTLTAADADATGDKWSHTFTALPETDSVSNTYTYSVAITSPVSSEYTYGIENKSATLGYILLTHTLITRDVAVYVAWDDAADRDGLRPSAVRVQLLANGVAVPDGEAVTTLTGTGEAWTYTFHDVQKYFTDGGVTGQEIAYSIDVTPAAAGELDGYTINYSDYSATLRHEPATTSASVVVVWADSNNQDGKRPASMFVQLYADNVPLADKYVLLSDGNSWGYTWDDLYQYADGGRVIVYSAHVTSTLVDYTAATTGMTVEMTYVPSATTIPAFATWEDGSDVDGLRPERINVELVADGVPTGDIQVLSSANGWTTAWSNYPIYDEGSRIEYTFEVVDVPVGYGAEYYGIYDTSGLSVVLTHARILAGQTVTVIWDDLDNIAFARPSRVKVMLYADGAPLPGQVAVLDESGAWTHTFEDMPVYRDGGVEIRYSAYVVSEAGGYVPSTDGLDITMGYQVPTVDVPLVIRWSDGDNADGLRPDYVVVTLTIDDQPTAYQSMATADNGWAVNFTGMAAYGPDNPGTKINYGVAVTAPEGYTAIYAGNYCVLEARPSKTSVTPIIHWDDNNDQYGQRPDKLVITLLADGVSTGKTAQVYAADNWTCAAFTELSKYAGAREIVYSIQVAGAISDYDVTVAGMDAYLSHKASGEGYTMDYTATVVWADNLNALSSRPAAAVLTLHADGNPILYYTLTSEDIAGAYIWSHTFSGLPTKADGKEVEYSATLSDFPHYAQTVSGSTITMRHITKIAVEIQWADSSDKDKKRPGSLALRLVADALDTGRVTATAGDGNTWKVLFDEAPIWSTADTTRQVKYTYRLEAASAAALAAAGYSVDYHGYEPGAGSSLGDTMRYTLTLTRTASSDTDGGSGGGGGGGGNSGGGGSGGGGGNSGGGGSSGGGSSMGTGGSAATKVREVLAYIKGYTDGTFRAGNPIARCEVAAIFARVSPDYDPAKTYAVTFTDVPATVWYRNELGYCIEAGIITGYRDGTFAPLANIDRGEFAAMAARFLELDNKGEAPQFDDVPAKYWADGYIGQLATLGIVTGDGKGQYKPTAPITRAEAVKIVNGILDRRPGEKDKPALDELAATRGAFDDLKEKYWAYYDILEATYDHNHEMK